VAWRSGLDRVHVPAVNVPPDASQIAPAPAQPESDSTSATSVAVSARSWAAVFTP